MSSHYKQGLEPKWLILQNNLDFTVGNIVKYIYRYPHKGSKIEDLEKIKEYCIWLSEYKTTCCIKTNSLNTFLNNNDFDANQKEMYWNLMYYLHYGNGDYILGLIKLANNVLINELKEKNE